MEDFFKLGTAKYLKKGEILHTPNEPCRSIGFVKSGNIRISRVLKSGKEIVLKEFKTGEVFADLIIFSGENYPGWLIANEDSIIIEVKLSYLLDYLNDKDKMLKYLIELSNKVSSLTANIEVLSLKTVKQKISYCLLYRTNNKKFIKFENLKNMVGCSREAFSRAISELNNDGFIGKNSGIISIENYKELEDILL